MRESNGAAKNRITPTAKGNTDNKLHGIGKCPLQSVPVSGAVVHGRDREQRPPYTYADAEHQHIQVTLHTFCGHCGRADGHKQIDAVGGDIPQDNCQFLDKREGTVFYNTLDMCGIESLKGETKISRSSEKVNEKNGELKPHGNRCSQTHSKNAAVK
ncbi:MAG: hypothetical protein K6E62_09715 [Lachnospiraceae bacterium]|nr:hypothetical protein [Lachnospiraceae bacterium]